MQSVAGVSRLDASSARLIRCSSQVYSAAVSSLASAALVYDALADHHEGMLAGTVPPSDRKNRCYSRTIGVTESQRVAAVQGVPTTMVNL